MLRLLAQQHTRQVYTVALTLDLAAAAVCLAVVDRHRPVMWLLLAGAALMIALAIYSARMVAPARRFLRQQPDLR